MKTTQIAILGAGNIARKMAQTIQMMKRRGDPVALRAVASRSGEKAQAFAAQWGVERAYGSYDAMLADDAVDLVYVATPHAMHGEQMLQCIQSGKAVLCEKAFTGNARQAEEVLALSREKHVLVAEAIWTRYLPWRGMVRSVIDSGEIGDALLADANLGYAIRQVERILRPELAGGALLDLGVYTLNFAAMTMGTDVVSTQSTVTMLDTGADLEEEITLRYRNGASAHLLSTAACRTNRRGIVYGTRGYLEVDNVNNPLTISVFDKDGRLTRMLYAPEQLTGFENEVEACLRALEAGAIECPEMPHEEILRIMRQMDGLRAQWGMVYPFD